MSSRDLDWESIGTYLGRTILDRILRAFAFPLYGGRSDVDRVSPQELIFLMVCRIDLATPRKVSLSSLKSESCDGVNSSMRRLGVNR
jgi:hypothetical protein